MKQYDAFWTCKELELDRSDYADYVLIQNDMELAELLDYVGMPSIYREDITGAIVIVGNADYDAVFLSESNRPYDLSAWYHPLPFFRWDDPNPNLPIYWQESNLHYQK